MVESAEIYEWAYYAEGSNIKYSQGTDSIVVDLGTALGEEIISVVPMNESCRGKGSELLFNIHPLPNEPEILSSKDHLPVCRNDKGITYKLAKYQPGITYTWTIHHGNISGKEQGDSIFQGDSIMVDWNPESTSASIEVQLENVDTGCSLNRVRDINKEEFLIPNTLDIIKKDSSDYILFCYDAIPGLNYKWGYTEKNERGVLTEMVEYRGKRFCRYEETIDTANYKYWLVTAYENDYDEWACWAISYLDNFTTNYLERIENLPDLLLYPNPSKGRITINYDNV